MGVTKNRMKIHYGWVVIFMGMLTSVGAHGFGRMAYTLILPEMRTGLGITYTQAGLLASGNLIGYLLFAFIGGFLAAKYGSRIVISLSLLLMGISMLLTGMATSFEFAFAMRLLTGIGNGGAYVPAMALGSTWFAMKQRGFATGIVSGGIGVGTCISGIIIPIIFISYGTQGWSYAWYYLGALVLFISAICFAFLRNKPSDLGLKMVGSDSDNSVLQPAKAAIGRPANLQWGLIYRVKAVWFIGIVYFMYGFSYVIYMTWFKTFLLEAGVADARASAMWAMVGGLSIFCGIIWGGISDKLGRNYGAALAYLTLAFSYIVFALISGSLTPGADLNSLGAFYLSAALFGLSAWSIPTIMAAAAGDYVGPDLAPAGVGFVTLFFGIGQAAGPALGGFLRDATGTFTMSFTVAAIVSIGGLVGALLLMKKPAAEVVPGAAVVNKV
ncbi:MAG: MFS transporter [Bacillota bacterium]|nr:MFS transporter [Bacillota bacterium]